MEQVARAFSRVNHGDFWGKLGDALLPGRDAKNQRAEFEKAQLIAMVSFLQRAYDYPTEDPVKVTQLGGQILYLPRVETLNNLPESLVDVQNVKPSQGAYLWARQQSMFFAGVAPADIEARTGFPFQQIDVSGKLDWGTILKQAGVFVGSVVAGFLAGGPAGAVAGALTGYAGAQAIEKASNIAKNLALTSGAGSIQASIEAKAAAEAEAQRQIELAQNPLNKLASFLNFENPYFIMGGMAIAAIILFVVFKHKKA